MGLLKLLFHLISIGGIFGGILVFFSSKALKKKSILNDYLQAWMIIMVINLCFYLVVLNGIVPKPAFLIVIGYSLPLLHLPLIFLGLRQQLNSGPTRKLHLLYFLPFMTLVTALLMVNYLGTNKLSISDGFLTFPDTSYPLIRKYNGAFIGICSAIFMYLTYAQITTLDSKMKDVRSDDYLRLNWAGFSGKLFVFLIVLLLLLFFAGFDLKIISPSYIFRIVTLFLAITLILLASQHQKILLTFSEINSITRPIVASDEGEKPIPDDQMNQITHQATLIIELLEGQELFANPSISLSVIAKELGLSNQQVSNAIKIGLKSNFYALINKYRIQKAIELLTNSSYDHYSIQGIGQECGFISKSTFYKVFKENTGHTPKYYRKK